MKTYEELVRAAKRDPGSVDYTELRLAYRFWSGYDPYGFGAGKGEAHGKVHLALQVGDVAGLIVALSALLEKQFPDIRAHQLAAAAYERIGDQVTAGRHGKIAQGLLDSILQSGDGQSFQTAFQVITMAEEYAVLETLKIEPQSQSLHHSHGQHFDVFRFCPASAAEGSPLAESPPCALYFNIDAFFRFVFHPEIFDALAKDQARRALRRTLGLWLLYSMPILLCLTSALLLEAASTRDLPALDTAGTILFLTSIPLATANFFLVLLRARKRRRP